MTPKLNNRYTINPFAHFDIVGLVSFLLVGFGWAKPVPVNTYNFRKYKKGCFLVSIAGVSINYLTSFLIYPLLLLSFLIPQFGYFTHVLQDTLVYIFSFGLSFCVFNLLPLYPLDGFRVVDALNKKRGKFFLFLRNYGRYILYGLFALSLIADITEIWQIDVLGLYVDFMVGIIQYPIKLFWGLFF